MKYTYISIIVFALSFLHTTTAIGSPQNDCSSLKKEVENARMHYEQGDLLKAIEILKEACFKSGKDKMFSGQRLSKCGEVKKDAQLLLSKLYLMTNQDELAEKYFMPVLRYEPFLELSEKLEPTDMVFFSRKYKAVPRFSITPEFSVITTSVQDGSLFGDGLRMNSIEAFHYLGTSTDENGITSTSSNVELIYRPEQTIGYGLKGSYFITRRLELSAGIARNNQRFSYEKIYSRNILVDKFQELEPSSEALFVTEDHIWWAFPLALKWNFGKKKLIFNVGLGYEFLYLSKAGFSELRRGGVDYFEHGLSSGEEIKHNLDIIPIRYQTNSAMFISWGVKYRPRSSRRNYFSLQAKYAFHNLDLNYGLGDYPNYGDTNNEELSLKKDLFFGIGYMDDVMTLEYFQTSIGYSFHFFKPKLIKQKLKDF